MTTSSPQRARTGGEAERPEVPGARRFWVWPIGVSPRLAALAWGAAGIGARLYEGWLWLPAALAVGALPALLGILLRVAWHQGLSAALLFVLFIAAVRSDRIFCGVAAVGIAFAAHSLPVIAFSAAEPDAVAACVPGGEAYWQANLSWILTGEDPEYEIVNWLPAHIQLLAAIVVLGYLSLGLIPFYEGFYEVDLMNYYVGRLVTESAGSPVAVLLGWHAWSVARGLCYTVLVFEVAQWSLGRITGRDLAAPAARRARWAIALGFFLVDCGLKLFVTEPVRALLARVLKG